MMKSILKFLGLVLVVAGASFGISLLVSRKSGGSEVSTAAVQRFSDSTNQPTAVVTASGAQRISSEEIDSPFLLDTKQELRFYQPRTGELRSLKLSGGSISNLIATIKPFASRVAWSSDGNAVVAQYPTQTIYTDLTTGKTKMLAKQIIDPVFSKTSGDVAYLYFNDNSDEGAISVADRQFDNYKNILKTRLKSWELQWNADRRLSLIATTPGTNLQTLFVLGTDDQKLTSVLQNQKALRVTWSPSGQRFVASHAVRQGNQLFVVDTKSLEQITLDIATTAADCAWSSEVMLYCTTGEKESTFMKINLSADAVTPEQLLAPAEASFAKAQSLMYSPSLQALLFINAQDGKLYKASLSH